MTLLTWVFLGWGVGRFHNTIFMFPNPTYRKHPITGVHSNQDQILCVKIGLYGFLNTSWVLINMPPVIALARRGRTVCLRCLGVRMRKKKQTKKTARSKNIFLLPLFAARCFFSVQRYYDFSAWLFCRSCCPLFFSVLLLALVADFMFCYVAGLLRCCSAVLLILRRVNGRIFVAMGTARALRPDDLAEAAHPRAWHRNHQRRLGR